MNVKFIGSIKNICKESWEAVVGKSYPFMRYEFLSALEDSGAVSAATGWIPHHALVYERDNLIAAMPAYIKNNSYGEFVFDFQWASAYQQNGLNYYPKLVSAIPFSPVTGPRIGIQSGYDEAVVIQALTEACIEQVKENGFSSWHILFPSSSTSKQFENNGLITRRAVHFQWINKNYGSFGDFLVGFNSRHRKNLQKERKRIQEQGITLHHIEGASLTDKHWKDFYHFYQLTYAKHSGHGGYLSYDFFYVLGREIPEQLMMVVAIKNDEIIAAALNLKDSKSLYGRYWGTYQDYDFLHFETCYYQGIEYCIKEGLKFFEPGVQGEHKIQRGFNPVFTYSNHWIADGRFGDAIKLFLQEEDRRIINYKTGAEKLLPFKQVR